MLPSFTFIAKEMVTVGISRIEHTHIKGKPIKKSGLRGDCPNTTLWHFLGLNFFIGAPLRKSIIIVAVYLFLIYFFSSAAHNCVKQ